MVLIVVIAAVAAMISASVYLSRRSSSLNPNTPGQSRGSLKGGVAPEFELTSLEGKQVKLSDYRGKAVLLNFWATYCAPCKIEMPWFEELQKQYGAQGLVVLGIAMDDVGKDELGKFAKEVGASYTILIGKEAVGEAYGGVQFLPSTFYIDRQGKVVDHVFGLVSHSEIEDNIKKALNAKPDENKQASSSPSGAQPAAVPKPAEAR
jgi:peroxiredoxin